MMDDIKSGKDEVSYVLVFKLSRFGRNAADVLATLQVMQDFGVNLICVEDGIDSSKDAGKLMISVLSAVAEIERENIRVQTMEGRMQKAREGKWNGGFAPYGYALIDGKLVVNEEEAVVIRTIFDQYVNTDLGENGIAKYLENHGIHKIARQNGKNPLFDAALIRRIIQNPVYSGKISYGRRRTEKVHGTRNEYRQVKKDDYLLVDGLHEALVSEEVWEQAQVKVAAQAKKYEKVNRDKKEKIHLLSGILKCPVCGAGMYGNKAIKKRKDGSHYKDFYYYGCKHRNMTRGHKCGYKKQVHEEMLDASVAEVISKLVSNPKFSDLIRSKINMEVDTSALDQEIANYEKQLRQLYHNKDGKVLEPSVGDGRFLDAFEKEESIEKIVAVELIEEKVGQLKNRGYLEQVEIVADDFLDFAEKTSEKYQLIIGNPPYINIKNMENNSKEKAKEICEKFQLPNSLMQNMWVAFVLAAVSCLERDGTIFFVLPMEFLQVQYAEKIRLFLEEHFDTIHILSFKERMFPKIEQESCLVYLTNEFKNQPYINFKIYAQLDSDYPYYCSKIQRNKPLKKWTNAILSDEDIDLLNMIDSKYKKVSEVCEASPGIVTGANNEFILTKEQVEQLECHEFVLPTIAKSIIVNGQFILTQDVVEKIGERGNRIYLLNLSHVDEKLLSKSLMEYLTTIGEKQNAAEVKLKDRYKCRNRKPWYGVPIVRNGDLFFFKRYDKIPRICVNETDLYTTDIAYNMRLDSAYDKESMAFCFYNSLTLTQCEFYGRYYAGGVSELTPSEFKRLAIPYRKIDKDDIKQLSEMFKANENIDKIIAFVNLKTIEKDWEHKQILKLDKMRRKLMERRLP